MKQNALRTEFFANLKKNGKRAVVRMCGEPSESFDIVKETDSAAVYYDVHGKDDSFFYSHEFVERFAHGGCAMVNTDDAYIAKHLILTVLSKELNIGVRVRMNDRFMCVLRYHGDEDDNFFNDYHVYSI